MDEVLGLAVLLAAGLVLAVVVVSALAARALLLPPRHTAGWAVGRGLPVDPGGLGLAWEAWELDRPDGSLLPVWEIAAPGAAARPLTIVFVHGWGESRLDVLGRLEPWTRLCRRLVLYDRRGHGDARGSAARLGRGEDEDLAALLERLGDGPFLLVGRGCGAAVALAAAGRCRRVAGVVAREPVTDLRDWTRRTFRRAGWPAGPMVDLALLWLRLAGRGLPRGEAVAACPVLTITDETEDPAAIGNFVDECK